jgi:integrase
MGSLAVQKRPNDRWRLINQVFISGKRKSIIVPIAGYAALGIDPSWSVEKVRERVSQINAQNAIETHKIIAATRRVEANRKVVSAYLPDELVAQFNEELGHRPTKNNDMIHWRFVQKMIAEIGMDPADFADRKAEIYRYYQSKAIGYSYTEKVTYILNQWGKFVSRKRKQYFEPLDVPKGREAQRIKETQRKAKPSMISEELTPAMLDSIKDKLPSIEQYNWLGASVWFGLRPEEIDLHRCDMEQQGDVAVLWVYQPKLTSLPEEKRWKPIPILYPEQERFLPALIEGRVERPLNKVLKDRTKKQVTGYGGRKGFVDLMLSLGQQLPDISVWMGHQSIERTWKSYKNKQRVSYTKPAA